jgi:pseudouridylate synthase
LEQRVDTPEEAAAIVRTHRILGLPGAIVLAQPVPTEHALDPKVHQVALDHALEQAAARKIAGKPLTPFLLNSIQRTTEGKSLRANCALLVSNARLVGEVARLLMQT